MNTAHLPVEAQRDLVAVVALMNAEDRGFCEALPGLVTWDGEGYAFGWVLEKTDTRQVNVHLLTPKIVDDYFHSHLWLNESTILSGGYVEIYRPEAWSPAGQTTRTFRTADKIARNADCGHHLTLLPDLQYTLTAFITGPAIRERRWGAHCIDGEIGPAYLGIPPAAVLGHVGCGFNAPP